MDVLIVGSPYRDDVHDRLNDAATLLHREVNPTFVSAARWSDPSAAPLVEARVGAPGSWRADPATAAETVASRPMVSIVTPDYTPRGLGP